MRGVILLGLLLVFAPPAIAHDGPHGLEVSDLRVALHPGIVGGVASFTLANDATGPANHAFVYASVHGAFVRTSHSIAPLASGETTQVSVEVPMKPAAHLCIQAVAGSKSSDVVCAFASDVRLP